MSELLTWQSMTTYAGSTLATATLTQLLKELGVLKRIPTRLLSYCIAVILLLLAAAFTCGLTLPRLALAPINAAMISLASNGAYDAIVPRKADPPEG